VGLHVHVPIRVRLHEPVGSPDVAELEAAVVRAGTRALETVRQEILEPRGPHRRVRVHHPPVVFAGRAGGDALDERSRVAVAEAVARGLAEALPALAVVAGAATASRLTGQPSEPIDRSRLRRGVGDQRRHSYYRLPFFDGGEVDVPAPEEETEEIFPEPGSVFSRPLPGVSISFLDALSLAWDAHVARHGAKWDPALYGYPGYSGLIDVDGKVQAGLVWFTQVDKIREDGSVANEDAAVRGQQMRLIEVRPDGTGFVDRTLTPTIGYYELVRTDQEATVESVDQRLAEIIAKDPVAAGPLKDQSVRRAYAIELMKGPPGQLLIYNLLGGPHDIISVLPSDLESPIRFVTAQMVAGSARRGPAGTGGTGTGTGRGTGAGAASGEEQVGEGAVVGGPLGTAAAVGEGRLWPVDGPGGEPLICEPYLGEPRVEDLVEGGKELTDRINRLATLLEVPACGYAGRFALNCALAIGGRARGVGLASVQSTATTVVDMRPDGQGNNGWLDVRPGAAPELEYLRLLGRAVRDSSALANETYATYLKPANRHLVYKDEDRELEPDAAGWGVDFSPDFGEALTLACMHLYAETCRVLLLQQLRFSRASIRERREQRYDETLERFQDALDILGESAVVMSTLRMAVRHGRRVYTTGSVREVLSVSETVYAGPEGYPYDLPPPIDSVPPRMLELLADARIERRGTGWVAVHAGRDWTDDELAQALAARRGTLNAVDPLFLQVEDLDQLYRQSQGDRSKVDSYLKDLLKEMCEANDEMLGDSSDPDDGSFFALEASQWVEAEGGRDARGLKFELHGIHKLADDELRPHVGGVYAYVQGVNMAIGIKAGFDRLLGLFSSVGIIVLGLLCAPLGLAVAAVVTGAASIALTVHDVLEARERERLYRALEDPEAILSWQEVEMARLMANIGIAFSIFDVIGVARGAKTIAGGAIRALGLAERAAAGGAFRSLTQAARREIVQNMSRELLEHAFMAAVSETVIAQVMEQLLPTVIEPVLVPWLREQAIEHGTLAEVDAALGPLAAEYELVKVAAPTGEGQPEAPAGQGEEGAGP
jgi:hypothetical protein